MDKIILYFIRALRHAGISVSLSEAEDALEALAVFGVADQKRFYQLLRATLLKSEADAAVFDLVYGLFFAPEPPAPAPADAKTPAAGCEHNGEAGTGGMSPRAKRFYGALRNRNSANVDTMLEDALTETDPAALSAAELLEQLKISLGWFMAAHALKENDDAGGLAYLQELDTYLALRCQRRIVDVRGEEGVAETLDSVNLRQKDFIALSEAQVAAMEKQLARLGKKLAGRFCYRLKPAKGGIPDMRRVMAETARRGHLPATLKHLDKVRNRPDLLVLCDISGSMAIYSSFCLQLVYAMARRFDSLRCFLFIDNIVESTPDFRGKTVAEAVAAALEAAYTKRTGRNKHHCTTTGISDYGKALENFNKKFGHDLTAKTTVLILGDARGNYFPAKPEELREIRGRVKKIVWLNPEPKTRWNSEDSLVNAYLPYCGLMAECRSLCQLETAILHI